MSDKDGGRCRIVRGLLRSGGEAAGDGMMLSRWLAATGLSVLTGQCCMNRA